MKVTGWTSWDNKQKAKREIPNSKFDEAKLTVIEALREGNYHFTGFMHQSDANCVPIIDDTYRFQVSQRTWGEIMYLAFPKEDYSKYEQNFEYAKWAWICDEEEIIPISGR